MIQQERKPAAARELLYAPSQRQDSTHHGLCYTSGGALAGINHEQMLYHEARSYPSHLSIAGWYLPKCKAGLCSNHDSICSMYITSNL